MRSEGLAVLVVEMPIVDQGSGRPTVKTVREAGLGRNTRQNTTGGAMEKKYRMATLQAL